MFLGVLMILAGILAIVFRKYIKVGNQIEPYYRTIDPANPKREINNPGDQLFVALVGVGFIVTGILSLLGIIE